MLRTFHLRLAWSRLALAAVWFAALELANAQPSVLPRGQRSHSFRLREHDAFEIVVPIAIATGGAKLSQRR